MHKHSCPGYFHHFSLGADMKSGCAVGLEGQSHIPIILRSTVGQPGSSVVVPVSSTPCCGALVGHPKLIIDLSAVTSKSHMLVELNAGGSEMATILPNFSHMSAAIQENRGNIGRPDVLNLATPDRSTFLIR